jgi:hypothetical protein
VFSGSGKLVISVNKKLPNNNQKNKYLFNKYLFDNTFSNSLSALGGVDFQ